MQQVNVLRDVIPDHPPAAGPQPQRDHLLAEPASGEIFCSRGVLLTILALFITYHVIGH